MRQGQALRTAGTAEDVPAISAVMFPVREGKLLSTPHAHVRIGAFRWRRRVEHGARDFLSWRELEALVVKRGVGLGDIRERIPPLCGAGPILYQLKCLIPHIRVQRLPKVAIVPAS